MVLPQEALGVNHLPDWVRYRPPTKMLPAHLYQRGAGSESSEDQFGGYVLLVMGANTPFDVLLINELPWKDAMVPPFALTPVAH